MGEKTNNGIHYRLQLLYSNGESFFYLTIICLERNTQKKQLVNEMINQREGTNKQTAVLHFNFIFATVIDQTIILIINAFLLN